MVNCWRIIDQLMVNQRLINGYNQWLTVVNFDG